jgi:Protein of unknown function (DUF3606)
MSELIKPIGEDRSKIRPDDCKRWAKHLRVSSKDLQSAIEKVGNSAAAVKKELRSMPVGAAFTSGSGEKTAVR